MSSLSVPAGDSVRLRQLTGAIVTADLNVSAYNTFTVPKLTENLTVPIPSGTATKFRRISFQLTAGASAYTVTWTTGAGGYLFATAGSSLGVTQAQHDNALADALEDDIFRVLWEYNDTLNRWVCLAMSGPFT